MFDVKKISQGGLIIAIVASLTGGALLYSRKAEGKEPFNNGVYNQTRTSPTPLPTPLPTPIPTSSSTSAPHFPLLGHPEYIATLVVSINGHSLDEGMVTDLFTGLPNSRRASLYLMLAQFSIKGKTVPYGKFLMNDSQSFLAFQASVPNKIEWSKITRDSIKLKYSVLYRTYSDSNLVNITANRDGAGVIRTYTVSQTLTNLAGTPYLGDSTRPLPKDFTISAADVQIYPTL
jgi:hypothetical protein